MLNLEPNEKYDEKENLRKLSKKTIKLGPQMV